ncbi:hypothetical protein Pmani_008799 [Petrolisthes manimaculis]|uniref:Uncharacterized protein n=1 Tax=Petrolisthes manimaculis TaxID=1843537 RepID=A0AAE1Q4P0_9EUCA|nr:hypothetical protein Pmani_008799 [Petrolisthes manimaculis]
MPSSPDAQPHPNPILDHTSQLAPPTLPALTNSYLNIHLPPQQPPTIHPQHTQPPPPIPPPPRPHSPRAQVTPPTHNPTSPTHGTQQVGIDGGPGNSPETPRLTPRRLNTPPEAAASPPPTQDEPCLVPDGFTTRTGRRIKRPCKLTYSISPISGRGDVAGRRGIKNRTIRQAAPHSQLATVSRPPRPRGIKRSCPGDVGLTDTLAKEEATPAVDAITHTRRQNHPVPQLYHLTPPTCT